MPSSSQPAVRSTRKQTKKRMIHDEKANVVIESDTDKFEYKNNQDETCVGDRNDDFGEANEAGDKEGKDDAKAIAAVLHQLQQPNSNKDIGDSRIVDVHCLDAGITSSSRTIVEKHSLCAATQKNGWSRYKKKKSPNVSYIWCS